MADIVRKVAYFAMDVPNRPGEAAQVLRALADAGVNLLAFSAFPSGRKSQLDFIPEDIAVFKKATKVANVKTRTQKIGFLTQGEDGKGAVADLLRPLAEKKINVTEFIHASLDDSHALAEALTSQKYDAVIHFAAVH